jgi:hypothetical protein
MSENTVERVAHELVNAEKDRIADRLRTADRGDLAKTVTECRAELELLETLLDECED